MATAEFFLHKGSPTYIHPENADVMSISQFMAQNLRQPPPIPPPPKHTFEISEGESVEIEKIVAAEKKEGVMFYKVKWVKYTWEAEESIQHLPHLIDGYWREHFYQNMNQATIDATGINLVSAEAAAEFARTKAAGTTEATDTEKSAITMVTDKLTSPNSAQQVLDSGQVSTTVGAHGDVILEFTMQNKDEIFPTRAVSAGEKKQRRSQTLERKYICQVCSKAFDRNTSLTRHMLTHTREKPFKCQLCEKAFSQNAHLKRHILIHIGQKSYQCNKCGKMFIEKGGLARHEATHSTEKPWVCNQCGKAFVLNEYLQRHLFLHTGQKPYQCNECGRLFADGSSWRAHKLTHNKEKKFKCHICNKLLKCKRNFKKHVQAHSEDKDMKHECSVCSLRFPNKKHLREHIKLGRKAHKCEICNTFLETKEKFESHRSIHPNSENYNRSSKENQSIDGDRSQTGTGENLNTQSAENGGKSDNESGENTEGEDDTLDDILNTSQSDASSQLSQKVDDTFQNEVPPSFTTMILKPENIRRAATLGDEDDEMSSVNDITVNPTRITMVTEPSCIAIPTDPVNFSLSRESAPTTALTTEPTVISPQPNAIAMTAEEFRTAIAEANAAATDPNRLNLIQNNLQSVINASVVERPNSLALTQQQLPVVLNVPGSNIVSPQIEVVETSHFTPAAVISAGLPTVVSQIAPPSALRGQVLPEVPHIIPTPLNSKPNPSIPGVVREVAEQELAAGDKTSRNIDKRNEDAAETIIMITQNSGLGLPGNFEK